MSETVRVQVAAAPAAAQLRDAIEAHLRGAPWPAGPEATVAAAVADAVRTAREGTTP